MNLLYKCNGGGDGNGGGGGGGGGKSIFEMVEVHAYSLQILSLGNDWRCGLMATAHTGDRCYVT